MNTKGLFIFFALIFSGQAKCPEKLGECGARTLFNIAGLVETSLRMHLSGEIVNEEGIRKIDGRITKFMDKAMSRYDVEVKYCGDIFEDPIPVLLFFHNLVTVMAAFGELEICQNVLLAAVNLAAVITYIQFNLAKGVNIGFDDEMVAGVVENLGNLLERSGQRVGDLAWGRPSTPERPNPFDCWAVFAGIDRARQGRGMAPILPGTILARDFSGFFMRFLAVMNPSGRSCIASDPFQAGERSRPATPLRTDGPEDSPLVDPVGASPMSPQWTPGGDGSPRAGGALSPDGGVRRDLMDDFGGGLPAGQEGIEA